MLLDGTEINLDSIYNYLDRRWSAFRMDIRPIKIEKYDIDFFRVSEEMSKLTEGVKLFASMQERVNFHTFELSIKKSPKYIFDIVINNLYVLEGVARLKNIKGEFFGHARLVLNLVDSQIMGYVTYVLREGELPVYFIWNMSPKF